MKTSNVILTACAICLCALFTGAQADVSRDEAIDIAVKDLKTSIEQSYHYRIDYDTVFALPVHSKTIWKNDFYLVYFLKNDDFRAEMEVDKKTGESTILARDTMSPPYHALYTGKFHHRYFNVDSMMDYASKRQRLKQDSVRLVYFGVVPKLGKRGVIWESFSSEGPVYFSLGGPSMRLEQVIKDINTSMHNNGNYTADSIRVGELVAEIERLKNLSDGQKRELNLSAPTYDSLLNALKEEKKQLIMKFPQLGRQFPLDQ